MFLFIKLNKIKDKSGIAEEITAIGRQRLALIVNRMKSSIKYSPLMTSIPVDFGDWLISNEGPFLRKHGNKCMGNPSLSATNSLFLGCLNYLNKGTIEYKRLVEMTQVANSLLQTVEWVESSS